MSKRLNEDYVTEHPVRSSFMGVSWMAALVVFIVVIAALFSVLHWGFDVGTSDIRGRGNAIIQKNSANNRIFAQQHFEQLYADIKAADAKLAPAEASVKANPGNAYYQTNYDGLVNVCIDNVQQYNQDSRKYLLQDFKTADLPPQIDSNDPSTDCKP